MKILLDKREIEEIEGVAGPGSLVFPEHYYKGRKKKITAPHCLLFYTPAMREMKEKLLGNPERTF